MKIILLDTETTDIGGHMIQIAWRAHVDADCVHEGDYMVKPPEPVKFGAMAIHHITNEMLEDKPPVSDELRQMVQKFLDDSIMVAHNAAFDAAVVTKEGMFPKQVICTYKVAYCLFPDEDSHSLQYLRYSLGLNDAELDKVNAHDAMGDVLVLEKLFGKCMAVLVFGKAMEPDAAIEHMIEISSKPLLLRKLTFGKHKGMEFPKVPRDYLVWLRGTFGAKDKQDDENLIYTVNYYLTK